MAKIKAGILSKVSGKVAGVVGATWKGQNYLRELVKPSNPNTPLQQAQRGKMSAVVRCARSFSGDVFKPYLDKFLKSMSGYNWFCKENIAKFSGENNALASALAFTFGTLQSGTWNHTESASNGVIATGETLPSVPTGHTLRAVACLWNDTTKQGVTAYLDSPSAEENVMAFADVQGLTNGDKCSIALFYVDIDANGVVQAISASLNALVTLTA